MIISFVNKQTLENCVGDHTCGYVATGVPGGGSESAEKRTKKEQFIAKLPNLKEKLHKKTDKHVVLSDHVVDSGGGVGGADGQDDTEGVGGMGHNNQSMSAAGAPSGGQTSAGEALSVENLTVFILYFNISRLVQ